VSCPQPPQACCLPSGACQDLDAAVCATLGGTAQGSGSDCATTSCPQPARPGHVPNNDDRPGTPLKVTKAMTAGDLLLTWGASCSASATDYTIHEGTIWSYYSHDLLTCTSGAALTATITPGAATPSRYYLIVAVTATEEGSYGESSNLVERPRSAPTTCRPTQVLGCN
jgi:hypothetical protein